MCDKGDHGHKNKRYDQDIVLTGLTDNYLSIYRAYYSCLWMMPRKNSRVTEDINRICRLCTRLGACVPIFNDKSNIALHVQAMSFAHIQIQLGDGLPDRVCHKCSLQLNVSYRFKIQCENSDKLLRSHPITKSTDGDSNFTFKMEIVSDNEDGRAKFETPDEDSVHSYTQLSDVEDNMTIDDTIFNSIKRTLSTEERKLDDIKSEPDDSKYLRLNIDKDISTKSINDCNEKTNLEKKFKEENDFKEENEKQINDSSFDHIGLKFTTENKIVDNRINTGEMEMGNDKKTILCHLCGEKYDKITSNCKCLVPLTNKTRKIRRDLWKRKSQKIDGMKWIKLKKKVIEVNKDGQETQIRRYMCDVCGQTYRHRNVLKQHQNTHRDIKKFSCDVCGKKFTRNSHVVAHMRIHNNIKPYICETCGRSFTKSSDLCRHKRIHSDAKNYACPICDRRFKRSGDISSHMRTHTGLKPYSCPRCDKSYTSHSSLKKHKIKHCKPKTKLFDEGGDIKSKIDLPT